jgi:hypothetical protein
VSVTIRAPRRRAPGGYPLPVLLALAVLLAVAASCGGGDRVPGHRSFITVGAAQ